MLGALGHFGIFEMPFPFLTFFKLQPIINNIFKKVMVTWPQRAHCSINWIKWGCFYPADATDWRLVVIKRGNMCFLAWPNSLHLYFKRSDSVTIYSATLSLCRNITCLSCVCLPLCSSRHFCDRTNSLHLIL